jgi:HlyD family secretion protein
VTHDPAPRARARRRPSRRVVLWLALASLGLGLAAAFRRGPGPSETGPTHVVRRGPLRVTVLEGGSLQPLRYTVVESEVEGEAKILSIVAEGTAVTEQDVAEGRVLVELDSSELRERISRREVDVALAKATLEQARAAQEIDENRAESHVKKTRSDERLAVLELSRYVGSALAGRLLASGEERPDVGLLLADEALDGEALQTKRDREAAIRLAEEEVARARERLRWTEELLEKGYVSADERVADRLSLERRRVELDRARTALSLYRAYEAPKEVESRLADLSAARAGLERALSEAEATFATAAATVRGNADRLRLEAARLASLERQLESTTIRARAPGVVVYATGDEWGRYASDDPIRVGAKVDERQPILALPDPTSMGVRVTVHESALGRVRAGQEATVRVDAFPREALRGRVVRVATIPDAANRWSNPDLKVYATEVAIEAPPPVLRPGMSAKVEIAVEEHASVLSVPVQALSGPPEAPAVWVVGGDGLRRRGVRTGASNDAFVVVLEGLHEGEVVSLAPPADPGPAPAAKADEPAADAAPRRIPRAPSRPAPTAAVARAAKSPAPGAPSAAEPQASEAAPAPRSAPAPEVSPLPAVPASSPAGDDPPSAETDLLPDPAPPLADPREEDLPPPGRVAATRGR